VEFTDPKAFAEALTQAVVNAPKKHGQRGDAVRFEYNGLDGVVSQGTQLFGAAFVSDGWFGRELTNIELQLGDSISGNITRLNNAIKKIKAQSDYYRDQSEQNRSRFQL
jgi:hypothetical protein